MKYLLVTLLLVGCSEGTTKYPHQDHSFSGVTKYFGFFGSGFSEMSCSPNCSVLVKDHSNLIWLRADSNVGLQMIEANANGLDSIISVQNVLFPGPNTTVVNKEIFCNFVDRLPFQPAAYYIMDEPYLNYPDVSNTKADLEAAIHIVNECAPGVPTAIIFSAPEIELQSDFGLVLPEGLDWAGMDCYEASGCTDSRVLTLLNIFDTLPIKHMLVPDALVSDLSMDLTDRVQLYQTYASTHDVVAVVPFLYQTYSWMKGLDQQPMIAEIYQTWFLTLKDSI